jgi:ribosome-associated translation inhibitor RaiA
VVVECPHRHHHKGVMYNIHIDLTLPGKELVITREPAEDLYVAIRDSFDVATRQVREYMQKRNGHVKNHGSKETVVVDS